ncbi:Fe-S-cluster-containing dehydrogenase component [Malonomonas rubra DSM 5091]|uniref:Fe-S-cluster-containing dehydrogenase component n=1 Tax=Malonomonas rubra DSM 5091 TaxID=1122189 RepID=A0A1M6L468_MALRU|nr:4Fe-4S dicluster domain-containing protein [Malonomonas rubra]SHJ65953.1 Fe-S-cluster-containing dehydrogenase component [Malonomonas rubra DSM 5091]
MNEDKTEPASSINRRQFIIASGALGAAVLLPGGLLAIPNSIPDSKGFLLIDLKKCQGCGTCMMSCALAHSGEASYSLARIQIQQDSFTNWPDDVSMAVCHQCQDAPCVAVCPVRPVKANKPNPSEGNVRMIDPALCIGCKLCLVRCPFTPGRIQWNVEEQHSQKCDLCIDTPYLAEKGGPGGMQTCVRVCPVEAISFTTEMPDQSDEDSYTVNLRGRAWAKLGMTTK